MHDVSRLFFKSPACGERRRLAKEPGWHTVQSPFNFVSWLLATPGFSACADSGKLRTQAKSPADTARNISRIEWSTNGLLEEEAMTVAAVNANVAAHAVAELRPFALIMEGGRVSVTRETVVASVASAQQLAIGTAVREVTCHAAIFQTCTMLENEGGTVFLVAVHAGFARGLRTADANLPLRVRIVARGAADAPLAKRMRPRPSKLGGHIAVAGFASPLNRLQPFALRGRIRRTVAVQAGDFVLVVHAEAMLAGLPVLGVAEQTGAFLSHPSRACEPRNESLLATGTGVRFRALVTREAVLLHAFVDAALQRVFGWSMAGKAGTDVRSRAWDRLRPPMDGMAVGAAKTLRQERGMPPLPMQLDRIDFAMAGTAGLNAILSQIRSRDET